MIECSFITAALSHGNKHGILYKNTHKFDFMKSVEPGDIVSFEGTIVRVGKTSLTIHVHLKDAGTGEVRAEGYTTFVTIRPHTKEPVRHGILLDSTDDPEELRWREEAAAFFS